MIFVFSVEFSTHHVYRPVFTAGTCTAQTEARRTSLQQCVCLHFAIITTLSDYMFEFLPVPCYRFPSMSKVLKTLLDGCTFYDKRHDGNVVIEVCTEIQGSLYVICVVTWSPCQYFMRTMRRSEGLWVKLQAFNVCQDLYNL